MADPWSIRMSVIGAVMAVTVSGAALAVSLLHAGPAGRAGLAGPPGPSAEVGKLGYCITIEGNTNIWVTDISAPVVLDGVTQCLRGSFVPLVAKEQTD